MMMTDQERVALLKKYEQAVLDAGGFGEVRLVYRDGELFMVEVVVRRKVGKARPGKAVRPVGSVN